MERKPASKRGIQLMLLLFLTAYMAVTISPNECLAISPKWKKQNNRGNRYEGRIDIPIGKPDLELLSFVGCREAFTGDVNLKVRFYLPTSASVFIQGRELSEQKHYWMESKPPEKAAEWKAGAWNEFGPWATREVLVREEIPSSNLGVLVRLQRETTNGGEVAPAFVYHSTLPASVNSYILYLRPDLTLKKVQYSLYRLVGNQEAKVKTSTLVGDKSAGEPFPIELDMGGISEGPMLLLVEGKYRNRTGGPTREYKFYHKPQVR